MSITSKTAVTVSALMAALALAACGGSQPTCKIVRHHGQRMCEIVRQDSQGGYYPVFVPVYVPPAPAYRPPAGSYRAPPPPPEEEPVEEPPVAEPVR